MKLIHLQHACIVVLVVLFTYTATSKLFAMTSFHFTLLQIPLLRPMSRVLVWLVPLFELLLVVLLLFHRTVRLGLVLSFLFLVACTAYMVYMLLYLPQMPCACGGVIGLLSWPQHVMLNVFFAVLGGCCLLCLMD